MFHLCSAMAKQTKRNRLINEKTSQSVTSFLCGCWLPSADPSVSWLLRCWPKCLSKHHTTMIWLTPHEFSPHNLRWILSLFIIVLIKSNCLIPIRAEQINNEVNNKKNKCQSHKWIKNYVNKKMQQNPLTFTFCTSSSTLATSVIPRLWISCGVRFVLVWYLRHAW